DLGLAGVDAKPGPADALEARYRAPPAPAGLEGDRDTGTRTVGLLGEVLDVAFLLEDARDLALHLGPGQRHRGVTRVIGVADAGEHVGNRIRRHTDVLLLTSSTSSHRESDPAAPAPGSRCGTCRTGACRRA